MCQPIHACRTLGNRALSRRRRLRPLAALALGAILLAAIGCGGGPYSTPEATFARFKTAVGNAEWREVCECLTPESRDSLAGAMVVRAWVAKMAGAALPKIDGDAAGGQGGDQAWKQTKRLGQMAADLFDKHGVKDPDVTNGLFIPGLAMDYRKFADCVSDKNAFIADMLAAIAIVKPDAKLLGDFGDSELTDVKIADDTATAKTDVEGQRAVTFRRIDGQWKLDYDLAHLAMQ